MPEHDVALHIGGPTWARLGRIAQTAPPALRQTLARAMQLLTDAIMADLPPYPPQRNTPLPAQYRLPHLRNGYPTGSMYASKFKTFAQQRYFFWALRQGLIQAPYKRRHSAGLAGAISSEVVAANDHVSGAVGINEDYAPYARYVVGNDDEQAAYHQGHWWQFEPTVTRLAETHTDPAAARALDELTAYLLGE
jgi:hypothetical protein